MRLCVFRVRTFRNVIDSTDVAVDDVTCLVGKNEAGKSAVMQALHALNPANSPVELDLLDEYPRWLKKEHEITGEIDGAVPIMATFELDDDEFEAFERDFGTQVLKTRQFTASRSYAELGTLKIDVDIDCGSFVNWFTGTVSQRVQKALPDSIGTSSDLIKSLAGLKSGQGGDDPEANAIATDAGEALDRLSGMFGSPSGNLRSAVESRLRASVPRTFYFSTYSQLGGRYPLDEVFAAVQNGSDDESVQAAADFLNLARALPQNIEDWDYEASNAELESISSLLTRQVKTYWHQNDHLKLKVTLEVQKDSPQGGPIRRYLQFRVEDTRHDFSSRLDRRSTGFRWFISFLAAFLEFQKDKNLILLLDEPGLSLHARAQKDLLDAMENKLANGRQVIYSTHSPFMVRAENLNHARIVEDQGPEDGTSVSNDAGAVSDPDTLFPLEAALGYDIAQNLFVGRRNILVEGVSDYIYLTTISGHLAGIGRASLPLDCRMLPAGGSGNIPTFLALLGTQLDAVVLIDGNTSDQRIQNSVAAGRVKSTRIISLDKFAPVKEADIEDLFEPKEYVDLYNKTYGKKLTLAELKGKDRIVKRIERKDGEFDHGLVAAYFLRNLSDSLQALSGATLDRFENVIKALTAALPPTS